MPITPSYPSLIMGDKHACCVVLFVFVSMQGGDIVIVTGFNFGPMGSLDPVVRYGSGGRSFVGVNCTQLAASVTSVGGATQQLQCWTSPGVGANLTWTVTTSLLSSAAFFHPGAAAGSSASRLVTFTSRCHVSWSMVCSTSEENGILLR